MEAKASWICSTHRLCVGRMKSMEAKASWICSTHRLCFSRMKPTEAKAEQLKVVKWPPLTVENRCVNQSLRSAYSQNHKLLAVHLQYDCVVQRMYNDFLPSRSCACDFAEHPIINGYRYSYYGQYRQSSYKYLPLKCGIRVECNLVRAVLLSQDKDLRTIVLPHISVYSYITRSLTAKGCAAIFNYCI